VNILFRADLSDFVRDREFSGVIISQSDLLGIVLSLDNESRWTFHIRRDPETEPQEKFTSEYCKSLVEKALGLPDVNVEIERVSHWECAERIAKTFRKGHLFLAGDAAHQIPPFGGLGGNTGISGAHNLAWKLAAVHFGWAGDALLDTYSEERIPVSQLAAQYSWESMDHRGFLDTSSAMKRFKERFFRILGFGFQYQSNAIISDGSPELGDNHSGVGGIPGTRMPHVWVTTSEPLQDKTTRLSTLDLLQGEGRFLVLAGEQGNAWCEAAEEISKELKIPLRAYTIGKGAVLNDPEESFSTNTGISSNGVLIVRPDGYVAFRALCLNDSPADTLRNSFVKILHQ
jgi:putative polyketide hydroxylase